MSGEIMQLSMNLKWKGQPIHLLGRCEYLGLQKVFAAFNNVPYCIVGCLIHTAFQDLIFMLKLYFRTLNGERASTKDFDALPEFATICAMCNDSSVDYNAVSAVL